MEKIGQTITVWSRKGLLALLLPVWFLMAVGIVVFWVIGGIAVGMCLLVGYFVDKNEVGRGKRWMT